MTPPGSGRFDLLKARLSGMPPPKQESDNRMPVGTSGHFGIVPLPSMNADFTADGDMRRVFVLGWGINDDEDRALFDDLTRGIDGMKLLDRGRSVGFLRVARPDTQRSHTST